MTKPGEMSDINQLEPMPLPPLPTEPLVSVLMANYNYAHLIGAAIESLQAQTWAHWELIICDDGSKDRSLEVASHYVANDERITIIPQDNRGQTPATNTAFSHAVGDVITLLDSDDLFLPTKLASIVTAFRNAPNAGMAIHTVQRANEHGVPIGINFPKNLETGWLAPWLLTHGGLPRWGFPLTAGLAFRREVANVVFPVPEHIVADAFLSGCSALITEVTAIHKDLSLYRIHGANTQGSKWPNSKSCLLAIEYYRKTIVAQALFAERHHGESAASALRLNDCSPYLATILKYHILTGSWPDGEKDLTSKEILAHLRSPPLWKLLVALPRPLALLLLRLWDGHYPLKRYISPGFRLLSTAISR